MKLEKLVGDRFKERPADCVIDSHALMVKGGYIKYMANGIYSSYMPLKRITNSALSLPGFLEMMRLSSFIFSMASSSWQNTLTTF